MSSKALSAKHEPLVRIVKRDGQSVARRILVRVAAIVLALVDKWPMWKRLAMLMEE